MPAIKYRRRPRADVLAAALDNFTMMQRERRKARRGVSIVAQVSQRIDDAHSLARATSVEDPIAY